MIRPSQRRQAMELAIKSVGNTPHSGDLLVTTAKKIEAYLYPEENSSDDVSYKAASEGSTTEEPTEPGFYKYDDGNQSIIFLLTGPGYVTKKMTWYAISSSGMMDECEWGYIEQGLGVYNLERI